MNDTLGHGAGDEFLRCLARRVRGAVRPFDLTARLGGDEFVVYLPGLDRIDAADVAAKIIESVSQPVKLEGHELVRSCSIGVTTSEVGDDVSAILRKADRAAYRAKNDGRNRFAVF